MNERPILCVDATEALAPELGAMPEQQPWAREIELRDPKGSRRRIGTTHG